MTSKLLPIEEIVGLAAGADTSPGLPIGRSRRGRTLNGYVLGRGPCHVSLIGGCHADEPVGPKMLDKLVAYLVSQHTEAGPLALYTWYVVPHVNPDGAARNAAWTATTLPAVDHRGAEDRAHHLALFSRHQVRELPGDDIEFGFPRGPHDDGVRPENRGVAEFLTLGAPFHLHASFHGMGIAPGPWFLIEESWIDRTRRLRDALRRRVRRMGYRLFDVDRGGEKGFWRIDEGFSTRPDSNAMAAHFRSLGDPETAGTFRPSSMEFVRRLGGDPFTLVSEMPLFLTPSEPVPGGPPRETGSEGRLAVLEWLEGLAVDKDPEQFLVVAEAAGFRSMPIRDQMRLQLAFLNEALAAVTAC